MQFIIQKFRNLHPSNGEKHGMVASISQVFVGSAAYGVRGSLRGLQSSEWELLERSEEKLGGS